MAAIATPSATVLSESREPREPRSFVEVSDALSKAIIEIKSKKETYDKANAAVIKASEAYQESVKNAQFLREELNKTLDSSMGTQQSGRVRASG